MKKEINIKILNISVILVLVILVLFFSVVTNKNLYIFEKRIPQKEYYTQAVASSINGNLPRGCYLTDIDWGISMLPTMRRNDTIIVCRKEIVEEVDEIKEWDIVGYNDGENKENVHRIIGVYKEYYLAKGDSNLNFERVNRSQVDWVVKGVIWR